MTLGILRNVHGITIQHRWGNNGRL